MNINPSGIKIAYAFPIFCKVFFLPAVEPIDWNAEVNPCNKCNAKNTNAIT